MIVAFSKMMPNGDEFSENKIKSIVSSIYSFLDIVSKCELLSFYKKSFQIRTQLIVHLINI